MGRENEIRVIAHSIWEQEGCRDGHDCEHWLKAEVIWEQSHKTGVASENAPPKKAEILETRKRDKAIGGKS
jgi:hypothetical protein